MNRSPGLDLLRAFAIVWVMLFHNQMLGMGWPVPAAVTGWGWMGVDLFFALSGYLIGSQLLKVYAQGGRPSVLAFYRRRAFRILPAFGVTLALYFAVPALQEDPHIAPLWQFVTFTLNLCVNFLRDRAFSHVWSLCVEEHFYLLFPLIVWLLMRRPSWKLGLAAGLGVLGAGMFLRSYAWRHVFIPGLSTPDGRANPFFLYIQVIYFPTYLRLDGLLAGVAVAAVRWFRPGLWQKAMDRGALVLAGGLAAVAGAMWLFRHTFTLQTTVLGYPLLDLGMALLVAGCVSPRTPLGRFKIPGVQALAALAFSLYLTHKMVFHLVRTSVPAWVAPGGWQALAVDAAATLLAASLLYWLVERPFLALRERIDRRAAASS